MIYTESIQYMRDGEKQHLPGFDPQYSNIVDYILKITEEIWEKRAIWVIYDTYKEDLVIHTGATYVQGVEEVIKGTLKTLSSFPDRKMGGEAVIWSTFDDDKFYSSHRIFSTATNLGATQFGEATEKKVFFRTIADCIIHENKIIEEWLVRDNLFLIKQLGFDPVEMAKKDNKYHDHTNTLATDNNSSNGCYLELDKSSPEGLILSMFDDVWKRKQYDKIDCYYQDNAILHAICDNDLVGIDHIGNYLKNLFKPFSNSTVEIERITCNQIDNGIEVAVRWKLQGKHSGDGFFSSASNKMVIMPGINHYIVREGKIADEWMLFDGYDVLCQIHS